MTCTILKCNDPEVEIANSQSVGVCNVTYGSSCSLNCSSGFTASGNGEHVCDDVNDEGTSVKWRSVGGGSFTCINKSENVWKSALFCAYIFTANSNGNSNDLGPIIGGAVSVTVLLIIIFVLCIVVCSVRQWLHSKRKITKSGSDINMTSNPSYDIKKGNKKQEYQTYDYVTPDELVHFPNNKQDTVKLDTNLSYGRIQEHETSFYDSVTRPEHDVAIQLNPSYTNNLTKTSDNVSDEYVKSDQDYSHSARETEVAYLELIGAEGLAVAADSANVTINPNPSYESISGGVKLEDNPSYNKLRLT